MSPLVVVATVAGVVVGVLSINLLIWLPMAKKLERLTPALVAEIAASGETLVRGPERGAYRGATSVYGVVKGLGIVALTDKRLVFRKAVGTAISIVRADITGVRTAKWFMHSRAGGQEHVIVTTASGAEVGFFFVDRAAWVTALSPASGSSRS
jgi:hypothetical protein